MGKRNRRKFTDEQKAEAVRLARELGNISEAARSLDLHSTVLARWVKQAGIDEGRGSGKDLTTEEKAELSKLRRQLKRVTMERDFLKKAAAFFAKESDPSSK